MADAAHGKCSAHALPSRRRGVRPLPGRAALELLDSVEPAPSGGPGAEPLPVELLDRLAASLRELRSFIPDHVWWDAGAAQALIEYDGRRPR